MQTVIYLDVLLLLNLFVNYFLFLATAFLLHLSFRRLRLLIGSAVGSLFSLLILFDSLPYWVTVLIKLPLAALLVLISFGFRQKGIYCKSVLAFFGVNFLFGGVMLVIWLLFSPTGMVLNNGMVYFQISALTLVLGTLAAYLVIRVVTFLLDRRVRKQIRRQVLICVDGKEAILSGLIDTGNKLTDQTTGLPVVVCEFSAISHLIPPDLQECFRTGGLSFSQRLEYHSWSARIRLVPYHTIGKDGVLTAFRPDHFYLVTEQGEVVEERKALIGVTNRTLSDGEYQAILSEHCL